MGVIFTHTINSHTDLSTRDIFLTSNGYNNSFLIPAGMLPKGSALIGAFVMSDDCVLRGFFQASYA